jgi:ABC-2 type transport system permease protein
MTAAYSSTQHGSTQHGSTQHGSAYSRGYAFTDTQVMIARSLRRSVRDPEAFITALALPVTLMLLFVYVFGGAFDAGVKTTSVGGSGGGYVNYVVPGLIVLCAGFGAGTTAVAVATDMSSGIIDRFRSMPMAAWSVLAGHIVASLARNLLATALVIAVGLAVGWRPSAGPAAWLGAIAMIVGFILAMSWLAACFGLVVGSPEAANGATFILMFIPYLSSAFVPASTMARELRPVAANQPFTPVIETMRGLWMGHTSTGASVGHEAWLAAAYCTLILAIAAATASWLFRHRTAAR